MKMCTFLRYTGLFLALIMLLGCFAGCKGEAAPEKDKAEVTTLPASDPGNASAPESEPQKSTEETEPPQETDPEETLPDTFKLAIVNTSASVVRSGPGTEHSAIRKLNEGDEVKVYLQKTVNDVAWGNIGDGWICLDDILWKEDAEKLDTDLKRQIVGAWYQLYEDEGAEIWTFRQNGTFTYDVYIFDVDGPGSFGESNDQWCSGSYKVENGKLHLTFSNRTEPSGYVVLCGNKYYKDDVAVISATVGNDKLTLKEKQTVTLEQGDIEQIMDERNAVSSEDQALIDQLVGSWYMEEDSATFRVFTFQKDGKFLQTIYHFTDHDPEDYTESADRYCEGSYRVKNGALILHFNGKMSSVAEVSLGGITCKKGDIVSFSLSISAGSLKVSDYSTTTLLKGGLEEIKALVKENQPEDTPVIDTRILGEWRGITEIDTENLSLRIGDCYIFSEDGTFTGSLTADPIYLYNPETGKLEYDITQPGAGGYYYWGTYTFDGTTLTMTETGNEFDDPYMSTVTYTVSFSGDTMVQTDENGKLITLYPLSWDEIGEYFFGSGI